MQFHQVQEPKPCLPTVTFTNQIKQKATPYVVLSKEWFDAPNQSDDQSEVVQCVLGYLKRSKPLHQAVKKGGVHTLYTYDEKDPVPQAYVHAVQNAKKSGCQIARQCKGQASCSIVFQKNLTEKEVNDFLFGFYLVNYRWHYKSKKVETESNANQPVKEVEIYHETITEQSLKDYAQKETQSRIQYHLPLYILRLRYFVQQRANWATTTRMLEYVQEIKQALGDKVNLTTIIGEELLAKKLNLIHGVGRASMYPPALVSFEYQGSQDEKQPYLALIGKGVCFDTGGLSIKGTASMDTMYTDKTGACTVLEAFRAMVDLQIPLNIVCTVAFVENSVGSNAQRVSDIIESYKGLTVEILNTDAEGRLILADAMSYTQHKYNVDTMIELSTLTGAISAALGGGLAGLFTNKKQLVKKMERVSELTEEKFWHMPCNEDHHNQMKGSWADINNAGGKVGASCAAAFLENFVEKGVKWMHLDIAGCALTQADNGIYNKGATGFGLQQLVYYAAATSDLLGTEFFKTKKKATEQVEETKEEQTS